MQRTPVAPGQSRHFGAQVETALPSRSFSRVFRGSLTLSKELPLFNPLPQSSAAKGEASFPDGRKRAACATVVPTARPPGKTADCNSSRRDH